MTVFYPNGPEFMGVNWGFKTLLGQDKLVTTVALELQNREFFIESTLFHLKYLVKLPDFTRKPVFAIEMTYEQDPEKIFELSLEKEDTIYRVNVNTHLNTPRIPLLCTDFMTCK